MLTHTDPALLLDLLIDTTQSIVAELDKNGTLCKVSAPKGREVGSGVAGKTLHDLFKKETADEIMGFLSESSNSKKVIKRPVQLEFNGRLYWYAVTVIPLFFPDGKIEKFILISADIEAEKAAEESLWMTRETLEEVINQNDAEVSRSFDQLCQETHERAVAEEELSKSRKQYQLMVETVSDWIWEIDSEAKFKYSSPRSMDLLGYKPEELIGCLRYDFIDSDFRENAYTTYRNYADASMPFNNIQNRFRHKNGKIVVVESNGAPVFNSDGIVQGYHGVSRDITERTHFEQALRKSEKKLSVHLQQTPMGYIEWDINKEVLDWNPAASEIFGFTRKEALHENIYSRIVKPERMEVTNQIWKNLHLGPGRAHRINQNIRKDGTIIWCEWFDTVMYDENDKFLCVASLVNDITDRNRLEKEHKYLGELIELSTDIIAITSLPQQEIVFMNKAGRKLLGWSENENLSKRGYHKYHPLWVWEMLEKVCLPAAARDGFWQGDSAVISAGGEEIAVTQLIMSHKNTESEVEFFSTMVRLKR